MILHVGDLPFTPHCFFGSGLSAVGSALSFQVRGHRFEPGSPLHFFLGGKLECHTEQGQLI